MPWADLVAQIGQRHGLFRAGSSHGSTPRRQATLTAQAHWLLPHPNRGGSKVMPTTATPRDYALAIGERRAEAVRDYLMLQGVPAAQLTIDQLGQGTARRRSDGPGAEQPRRHV